MKTFRLAIELIKYRPAVFFFTFIMWTGVHGIPIVFAVLIGQVFDRLADGATVGLSPWTPVIVFASIVYVRLGFWWFGDIAWIAYWNDQASQVRRNMLRWVLEAPGARILPSSPGEAVSTFRDDVDELLEYVENFVDLGGLLTFAVGSVWVMTTIDAGLTGLVIIPLLLTVIFTQAMSPQIRTRRRAMRQATEAVTGFIGETFGAVQAIKLQRAEDPILDQFHELNETRRRAALRDTFLTELLRSVNVNMATIGAAIVLLVAGAAIRDGSFTVGELAVFLVYLPRLTGYMAFAGDIIAQHRRTGVAYERIRALLVDAPDEAILDRTRVPLKGDLPAFDSSSPVSKPLAALSVRGLSFQYPESEDGIADIDFDLHHGDFVVVTGRIGAGKTTLVRSLLGLLPAEGEVRWNGELVGDRASFFVPPLTAYTAQVPKLFSDTLGNNIALNERSTRQDIEEAIHLAVMEPDLELLAAGVDTLVGARGVKLSGGQLQRSAAARMFAARADLMVFDDLSSALDLHTEAELWDRLFAERDVTALVVSHRPAALERASEILLMDGGRIVDRGRIDELLERSPLMRSLWDEAS